MIKIAVFFALVAVAAAAPGFLHGGYAAIPAATSYSSRYDVHHSVPIVKTYVAPVAPVVTKVISPVVSSYHAAPLVSSYGYGHGLSSYGALSGYGLGYGHGW